MEVLSPFEGLDEGDWISPRISFSQDYQFPGRCSPKLQFKDSPEEEFSFNFRNSVNQLDRPTDDSMLSADELFFNGKLRPLQNGVNDHARNAYCNQGIVGCEGLRTLDMSGGRSIEDNPRCFSMTIETCRGDVHGSRAYMSLNNSRCSSPSRTMSMPRTTPTSPKASPSMTSSSSASSSSSSSSMSTPWMPSSLTSSSTPSKYSSKFKEFFKLKKMSASKDASVLSVPSSSASAEISRECPQSSGSASCRHPSRSFWPFSRSNSAGESKSAPVVSPPPRRSNSAGEGKTTSSSLLPIGIPPSKQPSQRTHKDMTCLASTNLPSNGCSANPTSSSPTPTNSYMEFSRSNSNAAVKCFPSTAMAKKGLPPLPNSSLKKTGSFFATAHCGSDAAIVSSQPISSSSSMQACASSHKNPETTKAIMDAEQSHVSTGNSPACTRETTALPDARNPNGEFQPASDVNPMVQKIRGSTASPGRPVRRGAHVNASRNFARGSPGRRGVWTSPGRGNGGRVSIRNLDRGSVSSKGHVRPKDMLSRDGASVRISPVLNVAVPSLRGSKASSKSKIFSLGNLFSKKEKVGGLHTALPAPDNQSGG